MILKVNPTRINLLSLKKDLKTAARGYRLLRDKRDGLMKKFMQVIKETRDLRAAVEKDLSQVFSSYTRAASFMSVTSLNNLFLLPNAEISIEGRTQTIMSVPIPSFSVKKSGTLFSYGLLETSGDLDTAVQTLDSLFPDLIKLAKLEKTVENLAFEIERTRRRASALENTMIPNLKDTIRFITMRLEEQARDAIVGTMRIKAMIVEREKEAAEAN